MAFAPRLGNFVSEVRSSDFRVVGFFGLRQVSTSCRSFPTGRPPLRVLLGPLLLRSETFFLALRPRFLLPKLVEASFGKVKSGDEDVN